MAAAVYSASELADRLGCSDWLIYKAAKEGTLPFPHLEIGRKRIVFPRAAVDRILGLSSDEEAEP